MSFNAASTPTVDFTTTASSIPSVATGVSRSNYKDIYDLLERLCKNSVGPKNNHSK